MAESVNPFASPQSDVGQPPVVDWATRHPEDLKKVKLGLTLVYTGICGMLVSVILGSVVSVTHLSVGTTSPIPVFGVIVLGFVLLMLIGQSLCIHAPRVSRARPWAIAAVAFAAICTVCLAIASMAAMQIVFTVEVIANLASIACFIFFIRRVANYIERPDVASKAIRAFAVGTLSIATLLVTWGIGMTASNPTEMLGWVWVAGLLGMLVALVMYANTVTYLRKAITV